MRNYMSILIDMKNRSTAQKSDYNYFKLFICLSMKNRIHDVSNHVRVAPSSSLLGYHQLTIPILADLKSILKMQDVQQL